jgi:hypothetical protein
MSRLFDLHGTAESIGVPVSTQPQLTRLVVDCREAPSDTNYFEIERSKLACRMCPSNSAIRRMTAAGPSFHQ